MLQRMPVRGCRSHLALIWTENHVTDWQLPNPGSAVKIHTSIFHWSFSSVSVVYQFQRGLIYFSLVYLQTQAFAAQCGGS